MPEPDDPGAPDDPDHHEPEPGEPEAPADPDQDQPDAPNAPGASGGRGEADGSEDSAGTRPSGQVIPQTGDVSLAALCALALSGAGMLGAGIAAWRRR